jgi:hypothetical protein
MPPLAELDEILVFSSFQTHALGYKSLPPYRSKALAP